MKPLTGAQRLRQCEVKAQIIGRRNLRAFMAGEIKVLPCWGDLERQFIMAEFDRLSQGSPSPNPMKQGVS